MKGERIRVTMDETYRDVEMLINKICHKFLAKKGLSEDDFDEWRGEASLAFVKAFHSYDGSRGARFSTWLWHCVWNTLLNKFRAESDHQRARRLDLDEFDALPDHRSPGGRGDLGLFDLSDDARTVVRIVLDAFGHEDGTRKKPASIRTALRSLLESMGWSWDRIAESFREVRQALLEEQR